MAGGEWWVDGHWLWDIPATVGLYIYLDHRKKQKRRTKREAKDRRSQADPDVRPEETDSVNHASDQGTNAIEPNRKEIVIVCTIASRTT